MENLNSNGSIKPTEFPIRNLLIKKTPSKNVFTGEVYETLKKEIIPFLHQDPL